MRSKTRLIKTVFGTKAKAIKVASPAASKVLEGANEFSDNPSRSGLASYTIHCTFVHQVIAEFVSNRCNTTERLSIIESLMVCYLCLSS